MGTLRLTAAVLSLAIAIDSGFLTPNWVVFGLIGAVCMGNYCVAIERRFKALESNNNQTTQE